jgi:hypothetical protein
MMPVASTTAAKIGVTIARIFCPFMLFLVVF